MLLRAVKLTRSPAVALIAGEGSCKHALEKMIDDMGLGRKVRLLGEISANEVADYYAHCLGVFFGPYDEDYGYVTLEAMLAAKPVITCADSGGPLESRRITQVQGDEPILGKSGRPTPRS
jgi:glycosyltransferase involved in cell wall biosynthesis